MVNRACQCPAKDPVSTAAKSPDKYMKEILRVGSKVEGVMQGKSERDPTTIH